MAPKKKEVVAEKAKEDAELAKAAKIEEDIAKYIRFNCPTNSTLFEGNEVHYFSGNKAVDTLLTSKKYGSSVGETDKHPTFSNRRDAATFLQKLMSQQMFFRAKKLVPKKKDDAKEQAKKKKDEESVTETEGEDKEDAEEKKKDDDKDKKKKKIKLSVHPVQIFNDDKDVYVWVFDPTPLYKKVIGLLMVVGTIVGCLFPLWPMWLRQGVYYLSMAALGFFGAVIVVAILRTMLFGIIWLLTAGQHKLWILPNLLEDCSILESFKPFYTYEFAPKGQKQESEKKSKSKKKDKDSDAENEETPLVQEEEEKKEQSESEKSASDAEEGTASETDPDNPSGSASEGSGAAKTDRVVKRRKVRRDDDFVHVK